MAIYLRWCMEHDLMGEDFLKEYSEVAKQVKADPASVGLRAFIRDKLNGQIMVPMFNQIGRAFTSYYYGKPDSPNFPRDIENYALEYLGPEKYYSDASFVSACKATKDSKRPNADSLSGQARISPGPPFVKPFAT